MYSSKKSRTFWKNLRRGLGRDAVLKVQTTPTKMHLEHATKHDHKGAKGLIGAEELENLDPGEDEPNNKQPGMMPRLVSLGG